MPKARFRFFVGLWICLGAGELAAHGLYDSLDSGFFETKWDWDPTLLFFVLVGVLYFRGLRAFRGKLPIQRWQILCLFAGLSVNALALLPPIDPLSDQLFFVHMIQHMMITSIGVPLMLAGVPYYIAVRGLTPGLRRKIYFPIIKNKFFRAVSRFLQRPLVSLAVFQVMFIFWHIPRFYNLALINDYFHLIEHGCFAASAFLLWKQIIDPYPLQAPLALPLRILFLAGVMASNIILSALLTFSTTIWYAYEGRPLPYWWTWGHVDDQRLGGLIMWVPGEVLNFMVMTFIFFVWVKRQEKKNDGMASLRNSLSQATS